MKFIVDELQSLRDNALFRELRTVDGGQGKYLMINGENYLSFCSNNYLDLANHPRVIHSAIEAIKRYGCGAGASRLISGNMTLHQRLEEAIAQFKGAKAAILFPTGYMANIGVITALLGKGDIVVCDRLNHASIIDGCKLSQTTFRIYPHADMDGLERILRMSKDFRRRMIITDTVFSMDGDLAPMEEIIHLANEYNAITMVDEAHGTGVFGSHGRGVLEHLGLEGKVDIVMGTLSKAVGSIGGFVCGDWDLINYLRNKARSFIYTTALPPSVCAASITGLEIIKDEPQLKEALWRNVRYLRKCLSREGIDIKNSQSPIIPIIIGDAEKTDKIAKLLARHKILIPAIRPPTVPNESSRLRITVMSSHTSQDVDMLVNTLLEIL